MRKETLLLLLYINSCYPIWVSGDRIFNGELMPEDPDICTTQNITFTCTLLDPPKTNHSIGFVLKTINTNGEFVAVDETRVRVVNDTVSQFTMHNVTMDKENSAYRFNVKCYYWELFGDKNKSLQLGWPTSARIYPTPEPVQDFNCVVNNYNAMRCSWKFGKEYGINFPELSIKWRGQSFNWNDCPNTATTKEGYCQWNSARDGYYKNSNITVHLSLKQKLCANISSSFRIDTSKIVKPYPVVSLAASAINSTCILVSWSSTESEPHLPKEHKVIVYKILESNTKEIDEIRFNSTNENENRTVCDLHPYTRYRFSVSIRPIGIYSGYYSDERNASGNTYSANRIFNGELMPEDPNICTTQNITFTCTLLDPPKTNHSIGFVLKTINTNGEFVAVDETRVRVINDTVSQFTMHNVTMDKENSVYRFNVKCYYLDIFGDKNKSLQLGEPTSARIYPTPEPVQDFTCVVINYNAMRCSWKFGKEYGINFPEISFKWKRQSFNWADCPSNATTKEGYCEWDNTRDGYYKNSNITVHLSLKQKLCANISSSFGIDTSKIVKPYPVVSLAASAINSTCILVSWSSTDSEPHLPKEHKVIVHKILESNTKEIDEIRFNSTNENENRTVCDLHPYTRYRFSVSIRPIGTYSGYYSDERNASAKTYSAKPSASPEITEGGFSWQPWECQVRTQRHVCTFWKQIKEEDMNGEIQGLPAVFTPKHTQTHSITADWAKDVIYACKVLMCDTSYLFSIKARNTNGTSENAKQLEIPAATLGLMQPTFVVESTNGSEVCVNLSNPETLTARGFTVAWCRNENGRCKNRHEIKWKTFPSSPTDVVIQIDSSNARDFLYGVSALSDRGSSGMDWQDCVYHKHAELQREPQNVIVGEGSEDNTLTVTWDKLSCMSGDPYIDRYGIQYQNLKDGDKKSIEVSALAEARIVLVGLEEDQPYEVTVTGITIDGKYGPESQPNIGTPVNRSLKPGAIVGISMGVLVCVIFAGVGCFCAIRRCKNKAKKAIREAGNVTIPDNGGFDVDTSLARKDSYDSGYDMTPPADKCPDSVKFSNTKCIRPDDYHFVTEWKGSKEGMSTDISKLDPLLLGPLPDGKGISRNSKEPSDILRKSSRKLKHILEIPKPLAFINHSESEISCEGSNKTESVKEKSIDYVTTKNVSINKSEHSKEKQNSLLDIPSSPENWSESDIKIDVKSIAQLPDTLEANQGSIMANFDNEKYAKGISRDNPKPLDVVKLLTQIPCPQEVNSSMLSSSDRKTVEEENDCELSRPLSITNKMLLEHPNVQTPDYVTTSVACSQPRLSTARCVISQGMSAVTKFSKTCTFPDKKEIAQSPALYITQDTSSFKESNRQVPRCSVGYVTSVLDPTHTDTNSPQSSKLSATQTPCCLSDTTSDFQKNSISQGNVSTVSAFDQYVFLTNSGQTFTPSLHAIGNNGYIPVHTVKNRVSVSAVGGYVPHFALENISDPTSVNDNTSTVSIKRNVENSNVFSSPDIECDIQAKNRSRSNVDTVDDKFQSNNVPSVVSKSPEYFIHPEPETYVPLNQDGIQSKSDVDVENIHSPGYVDETFANVPLKKAMDAVEGTDTSKSLKSETDGYVGHSVLENGQLNLLEDKKPQSDGYIRSPKTVDDHNGMPIIIDDYGIEEVLSKQESDSGLDSPEISPEIERKQTNIGNGYISCDVALSKVILLKT